MTTAQSLMFHMVKETKGNLLSLVAAVVVPSFVGAGVVWTAAVT